MIPQDPGWRTAMRGLLPFGRRRVQGITPVVIEQIRLLFVSFLNAFLMVGVVVAIMAGDLDRSASAWTVSLVVIGVGTGALLLQRVTDRPLDCSSEAALLGSYRTRFFLRIAWSELGALAGFVGALVTGEVWVYLVGFGFGLVGMARAAPTAAQLQRDRRALSLQGCGHDLVAILTARPNPS